MMVLGHTGPGLPNPDPTGPTLHAVNTVVHATHRDVYLGRRPLHVPASEQAGRTGYTFCLELPLDVFHVSVLPSSDKYQSQSSTTEILCQFCVAKVLSVPLCGYSYLILSANGLWAPCGFR